MRNWYEMPGALDNFEHDPAYLEKLASEVDAEPVRNASPAGRRAARRADCSWVKKRRYKKKMVRRFLTINPDMQYSKIDGMPDIQF